MTVKHTLIAALLASATLVSGAAQAEDTYIGANIGRSNIKAQVAGFSSISESTVGGKLVGGIRITPMMGLELGYAVLGEGRIQGAGAEVSGRPRSLYLAMTASRPLTDRISLVGKLGVNRTTTTVSGNMIEEFKYSKSSAMFGISGEYALSKSLTLVAEYDNFRNVIHENPLKVKGDLLSFGVRYWY